jgi:hydrogenase maturation factor
VTCDPHDHCITCGDEATPMRVVRIDEASGLAACDDGTGSLRTIEIGLVEPVATGDSVLVHADVALAKLGAPA